MTDYPYRLGQFDALDFLRGLPAACVDLVVTDPPYESLEKHRAKGTTTRLKVSKGSSNAWFPVVSNVYLSDVVKELARVMKRNSHLYLMCDPDTSWHARVWGEAAGLKWWNNVVWTKRRMGMGYHYRRQHELVAFFEKGKRRLHNLGICDVLGPYDAVRDGYPTEKPEALCRLLIEQSSDPGMVVLDPFMGSGTVGAAAVRCGRLFWGTDVQQGAVDLARARLRAITGLGTTDVDGDIVSPLSSATTPPAEPRELPRRYDPEGEWDGVFGDEVSSPTTVPPSAE